MSIEHSIIMDALENLYRGYQILAKTYDGGYQIKVWYRFKDMSIPACASGNAEKTLAEAYESVLERYEQKRDEYYLEEIK